MRRSLLLLLTAATGVLVACDLIASGPSGPPPLPRPEPSLPAGSQPLVIDMTGQPPVPSGSDRFKVQKGISVAQYIFDQNRDGEIDDHAKIREKLDARVPRRFDGVMALDWEHPVFKWFEEPPHSPNFKRALRNFEELLVLMRRLRPYARIGYYGLPKSSYWHRDEARRERSLAMADLLEHADWIGPKVYHPYKTGQIRSVTVESQRQFASDTAKMGLEVSRTAGDKPVYVWVTHRYAPRNKVAPNGPVLDDEFTDTLRTILEAEYRGRHVDGVIWWAADAWYLKEGQLPAGERAADLRPLHRHYSKLIAGVLDPGRK